MRARRTMLLVSVLGAASVMTFGLTGTAGAATATTAPSPDHAASSRPLPSNAGARAGATRQLGACWTASRMKHAKSLDALVTGKTVLRQTGTSARPTVVQG